MQVRKSILILVIVAACLASYFNALFGDFVWDDTLFIVENSSVMSFKFLPQFFAKDFWSIYIEKMPSHYYRPILAFSFMLDYFLWKESPLGFHISNLIFHILSTILVFAFVNLLTKDRVIAFISSLIFAVHPIQVEAVSFISGRVDTIPCIFFLSSLILFLQYFSSQKRSFYFFSLSCFFISLLTKEMAITLPLVVICIDYLFLSKRETRRVKGNFWRLQSGYFIIMIFYFVIRTYVVGWSFIKEETELGINFSSGDAYFWRAYTSLKILAMYMGLLFFPYKLNVDHMFFPANSLFEPIVIVGFVLLVLFIYLCIKSKKTYPVLSFSISWFFITLLPVSNLLPQGNIFAERYLYIPLVGFCIGVGFLFSWLLKKDIKTSILNWKKSIVLLFILLIVALGRVTYERNKVWENDLTLWLDAVKAEYDSLRAHYNLGRVYFKLNLWDKAIREYNLALQAKIGVNPESQSQILYNAGLVYVKKGMLDEARKAYEFAIELKPEEGEFYNALGVAYGLDGQYEEAIKACLKAIEKDEQLSSAQYNLALNYLQMGATDKAIDAYERFLELDPDHVSAYVDIGYLYYDKRDRSNARKYWLKALEISEDYHYAKDALKLLE